MSDTSYDSTLSLSAQQRVHEKCESFIAAWQQFLADSGSGQQQPDLKSYVDDETSEKERLAVFRELLDADLHYRRKAGQTPVAEEYLARFREFESIINSCFDDANESQNDQSDSDDQVPKKVGRYEVRQLLGSGKFGDVYLAYDDELHRQVAIKIQKRRKFTAEETELFRKESRILASLDHPNIVPVFDTGQLDCGRRYVVSKLIDGANLAEYVTQRQLPFEESAQLLATVAEALHYAHRQKLVHRDIKPANILVDASSSPSVADFGLALTEDDYGNESLPQGGSIAYMSPEQARMEGHRIDGRSDIFSLGVVMYEMLTGERPFTGDSAAEILDRIKTVEVRPPRMVDDKIPMELERICLKALSKRVTERYNTALDMANDLRSFKTPGQQPTEDFSVGPAKDTDDGKVEPPVPSPIIPKGLRSFDEGDTNFFLDLLPGPRDREGLPESIRFWKTRIEETNADKTFSVGLLFGPSGCGKTSLVKAGLLPRLNREIAVVYLEATGTETESQLWRGLRKSSPTLASNFNLVDSVTTLRREPTTRAGKKVLIVLDQFEQWLHSREGKFEGELVDTLRQCDGSHVLCIVMVRDGFSLPTYRFFDELGMDLLEGQNFALVDLFDPRHARKILAKYGRAYGCLPDNPDEMSPAYESFLDEAVADLSENGKIISVKLALFAEMFKDKTWDVATLKKVGGTEGVAEKFLEERFTDTTANPKHRRHAKAARAVLTTLLPETGTDIKGNMRSLAELKWISGYESRPQDFETLMRILDHETRLLTPTAPEGLAADDDDDLPGSPGEKCYQLTHDYMVPALRNWLTREQRKTRRGRAEIRLAERASEWSKSQEKRYLPSWWELLNIHLFTRTTDWSKPQRRMMNAATRFHGLRWGTALLVFLFLAITIWQMLYTSRQNNLRERTATAVAAMSTAREILVPRAIKDLEELPQEMVLAELRMQFDSGDETRSLGLAYALAHFGDVRVECLVSQVENASPNGVDNLVVALDRANSDALTSLKAASQIAASDENWRVKARLAMLAMHLNSLALAKTMCEPRSDPIQRTMFIDEGSTWHGNLSTLAERVSSCDDGPLRSAIALVVGSVPAAERTAPEKRDWETVLSNWFTDHRDAATHSSAGWALRQWDLELPRIAASKEPVDNRNWHENSIGMTMLRIPAGSFVRRDENVANAIDQKVTLTRSFLLSDREVSRGEFQQMMDDPDYSDVEKPRNWQGANTDFSPSERHPVQEVSWYHAVMFCNWLSHKEALTACYERTSEKESLGGTESDAWRLISNANGYRLPTEAEWEYACRAGTASSYSYGENEALLQQYAVFVSGRTEHCGNKKPNQWGLLDMHGNVWEWCYDCYGPYGSEKEIVDPANSEGSDSRVLRGGSFYGLALYLRSADRNWNGPSARNVYAGFRVARTYP